jgi:hypothetical protein
MGRYLNTQARFIPLNAAWQLHNKKVIAHLIGGFLCGVVEPWWPCFPESRRCGLLVVLATRAMFAAEEAGSKKE